MIKDPFGDFFACRVINVESLLLSLRREVARKVRQYGEEWKERGAIVMNAWCFHVIAVDMERAEAEMLENRGEPVVPWPDIPPYLPLFGLHAYPSNDVKVAFELVERTGV